MKKSEIKELIKEKYKSMKPLDEKEEEEITDTDTFDTEEFSDTDTEIPTTSSDSTAMEDALDAAIQSAIDYGDPKLSTLLDNAKIYLARSLARRDS
jgi:hypothetical protein